MLVAQKVNDLISKFAGQAICDRCICEAMGFTSQAHAAQITGALGTTTDFDRQKCTCHLCKEDRVAIRSKLGL
jgi:hypothetical protein